MLSCYSGIRTLGTVIEGKTGGPTRTFVTIQSPIGYKDGYWATLSAVQVHFVAVHSKFNCFFYAIERWGNIIGPCYVDENLETLRDRDWFVG
jgi:hypothetical protein